MNIRHLNPGFGGLDGDIVEVILIPEVDVFEEQEKCISLTKVHCWIYDYPNWIGCYDSYEIVTVKELSSV